MYKVLISETSQKQYSQLNKKLKDRMKEGLQELENDPRTPLPRVDIKPLSGTKPKKHRLRIGDYRIIYLIDKKTVKVIEVFKRGRGY